MGKRGKEYQEGPVEHSAGYRQTAANIVTTLSELVETTRAQAEAQQDPFADYLGWINVPSPTGEGRTIMRQDLFNAEQITDDPEHLTEHRVAYHGISWVAPGIHLNHFGVTHDGDIRVQRFEYLSQLPTDLAPLADDPTELATLWEFARAAIEPPEFPLA
ncbi:MAG TPA: hypothetical protein VJP80_07730 [Candidatus Saccharimonadales bacterium]|nr:hypothetical protein [Candidatus Saccharimonadales bacterium]